MKCVIGVDIGSSACKTTLLTASGVIAGTAEHSIRTHKPRPGIVEQDADEWYRAACAAIGSCLESSGVGPEGVECLAVDGGAHMFVAIGPDMATPVGRAIHWSDLRAAGEAEELRQLMGELLYEKSLQRLSAGSAPAQLSWIRRNQGADFSRIRQILPVKDYVRFRLTGRMATDPYDAAGLLLYNVWDGTWSDRLCEVAGISTAHLPEILPSVSVAGGVTWEAARDTGLVAGTPVAVGSGDSAVEAASVGTAEKGDAVVKLGTSANVEIILSDPGPVPSALVYPYVVPRRWIALTATNSGAGTLQWFDELVSGTPVADPIYSEGAGALEEAAAVSPGSDGIIFHPFLAGERSPYWNDGLKGNFSGLRSAHTRAHLRRAVMEGVAYSLRDCADSMGADFSGTIRLVGGGSRSPLWRQIVTDVLGCPIEVHEQCAASLGSAMLAGIVSGLFSGWEDAVNSNQSTTIRTRPVPETVGLYRKMFSIYKQSITHIATMSVLLDEIGSKGGRAQ